MSTLERPAFLRAPRGAPVAAPPPRARMPRRAPVARADGRHVPGEAGLWVLLLGDLTVFGLLFGAFLLTRAEHAAVFAAGRGQLVLAIGSLNTIALLTSSLFVARERFALAAVCASIFATLKATEWAILLSDHHTPASSSFFTFYFAITGLHFLHLLLGGAALTVAARSRSRLVIECCTSYWHLVDLLWLVIFPLLYLTAT